MPAPESVVLETNLGNIQLELYWDHAPRVCLLPSISGTSKSTYSTIARRARIFQLADLRELRTAGKPRLLQRLDISSNHSRMSHGPLDSFLIYFTYCSLKDFMVQGGDPTGTGRGGTSIYGQKLYVAQTTFCRSNQTKPCRPQRGRDPSRATVHGCRNPRNGQLGAQHQWFVRAPTLIPPLHFAPPSPS